MTPRWKLDPGRTLVRDGVPLVRLDRVKRAAGGWHLSPAEADVLAHEVVDALNLVAASEPVRTFDGLVAFLRARFPEAEEFDAAEAVHAFATLYHAGQWSWLYGVLSESPFRPGLLWRTDDADLEMMAALVAEFDK